MKGEGQANEQYSDSDPRSAAEWFLAIQAVEAPSHETLQAWLRWLEASPENRQAFEDLVEIWHKTPAAVMARPLRLVQEAEYDGSVPIAEWRARQLSADSPPVRSRRWLPLAVAATVVLVGAGVEAYRLYRAQLISTGQFATHIGEQRQLRLADGSIITLGAGSRMSVDLQPATRSIRLESGEAYFRVAKDPARPFIVHAMKGAITAVGTAFDVRAIEDRVTVTVTEGRVAVAAAAAGPDSNNAESDKRVTPPSIALVRSGEQVSYSPYRHAAESPTVVRPVAAGESTRWREGWLVYRNEPLRYVVADIERYTDLKLKLAESAANVRFSGAVQQSNIEEWIAALPEVAGVEIRRDGAGFEIDAQVQ